MKNIDSKLLNIGVLLTVAAFFGLGASVDLSDGSQSSIGNKHGCATPRSRLSAWPSDIPDHTRPEDPSSKP